MKNKFNPNIVNKFNSNLLNVRVYTSRLLGNEPDLVLHGGGNTSVKVKVKNIFGESEEILYIKGSGNDLATIDATGFAPVKMDILLKMAHMPSLSDSNMVKGQRSAMLDSDAPTPSVEAILHAIIPYRFVDHTHADAIVTISNTPCGEKRLRQIYGDRLLFVPYVMPGFILARKVYEMTRGFDWNSIEGILLLNHGLLTFHDQAIESYSRMIRLVTKAERYLAHYTKRIKCSYRVKELDLTTVAELRKEVSTVRGGPMLVKLMRNEQHLQFAGLKNVADIISRGPMTPDHIIRTKQSALVITNDLKKDLVGYVERYRKYFKRHSKSFHKCLDCAPRWGVWPGYGLVSFGATLKDFEINSDIIDHTIRAVVAAEKMGGWKPLAEENLFNMEYWELEQAKLKSKMLTPLFQGKIVLITGAASGIGRACVETFYTQGAVVVALDIDPHVKELENNRGIYPVVCDLTKSAQIRQTINEIIIQFGGLDILVSNAGTFPSSQSIKNMTEKVWNKSLAVNLSSHQRLLKACVPFLSRGWDPAVVIVGSKNVHAPGPEASAYSVAKAGLTQLARVAALELAQSKIRVNVVHPNQVFDTGIWTKAVIIKRAKAYGLPVDEYKANNLLKVQIQSSDVAALIAVMAGPTFSKTTGAQVPVDGGNERVI